MALPDTEMFVNILTLKEGSMNHHIDIPEGFWEAGELGNMVNRLLDLIDVEALFMSAEIVNDYRYCLVTVLIDDSTERVPHELYIKVNTVFMGHPDVECRIYGTNYAKSQLLQGNPFFVYGCSRGAITHHSNIPDLSLINQPLPVFDLLQKGRACFEKEMAKVQSFLDGANFYISNRKQPQGVFTIHLAIELLFRTVEKFMMGKEKICHYIGNHQNYIKPFVPALGKLFDPEDGQEAALLQLLDRAYVEVRYGDDYQITNRELKTIHAKATWMYKETRHLFMNKFRKCQPELGKITKEMIQ